jgi:hypothetical protein
MILKMNFNFNIKDMPEAAGSSIRCVTNVRDRHHTGKCGIKRNVWSGQITLCEGTSLNTCGTLL